MTLLGVTTPFHETLRSCKNTQESTDNLGQPGALGLLDCTSSLLPGVLVPEGSPSLCLSPLSPLKATAETSRPSSVPRPPRTTSGVLPWCLATQTHGVQKLGWAQKPHYDCAKPVPMAQYAPSLMPRNPGCAPWGTPTKGSHRRGALLGAS